MSWGGAGEGLSLRGGAQWQAIPTEVGHLLAEVSLPAGLRAWEGLEDKASSAPPAPPIPLGG